MRTGRISGSLLTTIADLADRYRELDRLKTDFVAITSHELRTPLTTVLGAIETMRQRMDELDRDELHRLVEALSRQAQRLSRLVDDLRTVSRVDAGTLHTYNRPTDVGRVVQDAVAGLLDLDVDVALGDALPKVLADPDRLEQVVANLLANGGQHGHGT
ncbi:MAG: HAMP domain-containing histidine kinase, partial [Proteobacteria bacterium]|nr:HAMP domain-containing histidine kinase [Pseudomonadota bacterium]